MQIEKNDNSYVHMYLKNNFYFLRDYLVQGVHGLYKTNGQNHRDREKERERERAVKVTVIL